MSGPIFIIHDQADVIYFPRLQTCLSSAGRIKVLPTEKYSPALVQAVAKKYEGSVLVASTEFMRGLLQEPKASRASYAGSLIEQDGVEYVILPELKNLLAGAEYKFLFEHYISKLTRKQAWVPIPAFTWTMGSNENLPELFEQFQSATFVAIDIETTQVPVPRITMVGFTGIWLENGGKVRMHTVVIPCNFSTATLWIEKFCTLPAQKIFQGGRYDVAWLASYRISPTNWVWDTMQMFHAWYAELPKDLGAISAFCMRTARYWKDLSKSGSSYDKMMYNALDCWNTANSFLYMIIKMPEWARKNYPQKFVMIYPAHMCEMRGIKVDVTLQRTVKRELEAKVQKLEDILARSVGVPGFNVASPKQVKALLTVLGADCESSDEKSLNAAAYKDPFVAYFANLILEIRGYNKLISTYLNESKLYRERWMSSLLPYGTETGRNSSSEMAFWCGQNLQNIPARDGPVIKQFLIPDNGFLMAECDSEQAESRDTAYLAGEVKMMEILESPDDDFHSFNGSCFFGIPYDQLFDRKTHKKLNKLVRDLAKKVNHGANYCMGANVLVQTMGMEYIDKARAILNLPRWWSYTKVAEFLLERFHATYKNIRGKYYPRTAEKIRSSKMLTGPTGWTRYCFKDISDKRNFNAYMAHTPQHTNAMRLDMAFLAIFLELSIHPEHCQNFRVYTQIHDSTFFQFREGHEYLIQEVVKRMEIPLTVTGCDGITRTYVVPAAAKAGKDGQGALRWSETE